MATTARDQRTVALDVSKAEMVSLLGDKAKAAGLIDFDPDRIQVIETDPVLGTFQITFEKDNV